MLISLYKTDRCARCTACDTRTSTLWLFGHHSSYPDVDGVLVSGWFYDVKKSHSVLHKLYKGFKMITTKVHLCVKELVKVIKVHSYFSEEVKVVRT